MYPIKTVNLKVAHVAKVVQVSAEVAGTSIVTIAYEFTYVN